MEFRDGHRGVLEKVKYIVPYSSKKEVYIDNLVF